MAGIARAVAICYTASVAKSKAAQTLDEVTPICLLDPIRAAWTGNRMLVDPIKSQCVEFIEIIRFTSSCFFGPKRPSHYRHHISILDG